MKSRSEVTAPYCLRCHGPLVEGFDASIRCPACGAQNLRVDMGTFWTRSREAIHSQEKLQVGGAFLIVLATTALMVTDVNPMETGWKVFALLGALIPMMLWWDLASLRTRKRSRYRSEVLMPAALLVVSAGPLLWCLFQWLSRRSPNLPVALKETAVLLVVVLPLAYGSRLFAARVERLRRSAQAEHAQHAGEIAQERIPTMRRPERKVAAAESVEAVREAKGLVGSRPSSTYQGLTLGGKDAFCLYCFAPISPIVVASRGCDVCGRTTRKVDQAVYWSRNERHLRIERRLKAFGVLVAAVGLLLVFLNAPELSRRVFWGAPFCGVLVLGLLGVWWDLAGMVTRYRSVLRLEAILPPIVAGSGVIGVTMVRAVEATKFPEARDYWGNKIEPAVDWLPYTYAWPFVVLGIASWFLLRWLLSWRSEVIARSLAQGRIRMVESLPGFAARQQPDTVGR
ncbi:hypothetical protein Poly30_08510 [Planctomycetes bacterium Poly30]|uniref:Uncharacterized protein n=1 Tax=Saltatorellus ferox TaxID=2528018 RepID=A0A518EMN7_9BACT|nr:hypothetical protein Poly30_08510 [Planctomycetes bacterium Poly30]